MYPLFFYYIDIKIINSRHILMDNSQIKSNIIDIEQKIHKIKTIRYPIKPISNAFSINKKINTFNATIK